MIIIHGLFHTHLGPTQPPTSYQSAFVPPNLPGQLQGTMPSATFDIPKDAQLSYPMPHNCYSTGSSCVHSLPTGSTPLTLSITNSSSGYVLELFTSMYVHRVSKKHPLILLAIS